MTTETANLMETLAAGGAEVALCASNPLSTQDDVAAALCEQSGIATFAVKGEDTETFFRHINEVLDTHPHITMDDGADMVSVLHKERPEQIAEIIGGTEETTTGVIRLRAMAVDGALKYPIVRSTMRTRSTCSTTGSGPDSRRSTRSCGPRTACWPGGRSSCAGTGCAGEALPRVPAGMGAHVIVTEVDPHERARGRDGGLRVMPIREAARVGDIFVTVTGDTSVIRGEHMELMKDGAIMANSGHFDVEIDKTALAGLAVRTRRIREFVDEYTMADGRRLHLLGEGRLVNLSAAEGHPAAVMDMSFANQALAVEWVVKHQAELGPEVYPVPVDIDKEVARLKLARDGRGDRHADGGAGFLSALLAAGHLSGPIEVNDTRERVSIRAQFRTVPRDGEGRVRPSGSRSEPASGADRRGPRARVLGARRGPHRAGSGHARRGPQPRPVRPVRVRDHRALGGVVRTGVRCRDRRRSGERPAREAVRRAVAACHRSSGNLSVEQDRARGERDEGSRGPTRMWRGFDPGQLHDDASRVVAGAPKRRRIVADDLETEFDDESGRARVTAYPVMRKQSRLRIDVRGLTAPIELGLP